LKKTLFALFNPIGEKKTADEKSKAGDLDAPFY